ncbi:MAG: class I SAM-dependent methyltransferase [Flavobacteriaceae bacterium]|nr:class I SAM-dependent methyltransferase [Flavobacteriaceae bacterium]
MINKIVAYIKFLLSSTNQHGVHSPFVYDLVTKCFYDSTRYDDYAKISTYKDKLLKDQTKINVTELGAGSRILKTNKRIVAKMTKSAGSTTPRAKLLYRLIQHLESRQILELGTSMGIATYSMHLAQKTFDITTIEGCPNISAFTKENFKNYGVDNVELKTGNFKDVLKDLTHNTYDLIYFDGNHQKQATIDYFETLLPTANNNTLFIFDDIYWSKGMTEAWNTIKDHPQVTVSIDTFFWGFVFFRKEQQKEHFIIRI